MAKARSHKDAGIRKTVSEAVYPADVLSEKTLMAASLEAKGAWSWALLIMWRDGDYELSDSADGFARIWGCDEATSKRVIAELANRGICDVSRICPELSKNVQECPEIVTLTCRRLRRRHKDKETERLRKAAAREAARRAAECPTDVPPGKVPSSSSSSSSSSVSPLEDGVKADDSASEESGNQHTATVNVGAHPSMPDLLRQFKAKCKWTGRPERVRVEFETAMQGGEFTDGAISAAIRQHGKPGVKPWELIKTMRGGTNAGARHVGDELE